MAYYLLYNGFWNPQGAPKTVQMLAHAAAREGIAMTPIPNTALYAVSDANGTRVPSLGTGDVVLCFDKDVRLIRAMEQSGVHVYNNADAVALCDDKSQTHRVLSAAAIPMPRTWVAPMAYVEYSDAGEAFLCAAEREFGYPMVLKECFGSLGEQVYLIRTPQELRERAALCGAKPFLLQEYIAAAAGRDWRLYVVGGRVVAAMERRNAHDFRANIARGSTGVPYSPTEAQAALAVRCCELLGLGFGGVDLLSDGDGNTLVCEVNASAQVAGITACTGVDVAAAIVQYVKACENG